MARYIDADRLRDKVKTETNPYGKPTLEYASGLKVLVMIDKQPTADVAEVVRCKDCKYNVANMEKDPLDTTDYSGDDIVCAYFMTDGLDPTDFCSYGKRHHKGEQNESNS